MKIITWNVNGIRAAVRKNFNGFLEKYQPDIVLLQETKISHEAREKHVFDFKGYAEFWNPARRAGYSGTAILVKDKNVNILGMENNPLGIEEFDNEGRLQVLELPSCHLVNGYFPNANHELTRLPYKLEFNKAVFKYLKKLEKNKPVVIGGDFNVAHAEIDLTNPKANLGNAGFTDAERDWIDKLIKMGYIDVYRKLNGQQIQYTWWSYRRMVRERNIGWRIDYFFASKNFFRHINNCYILDKVYGSDHCPVGIEII